MIDLLRRRFFLSQSATLAAAPLIGAFNSSASVEAQKMPREGFSVMDFGASGDGRTNDFVALCNARDFVSKSASTRKLRVPPGNYFIGDNEFLLSTPGMTVEFEGGAEIHGSGDFVVTCGSKGGRTQPSTHPTTMNIIGLIVRTVAPFGSAPDRAGLRVSASYSNFLNCGVITSKDRNGNGLLLESDDTGSGPYYNTFVGFRAQGAVGLGATGRGLFMGHRSGTVPNTRYPNTNTFVGGRISGYLTNWEIAGSGNRFIGPTSENNVGYGTAFKWRAPVPNSNCVNSVESPYIENAETGFSVDPLAVVPTVSGGSYYTGVKRLIDDPKGLLSVIGVGDGIRQIRLAATRTSGIFLGNVANRDPDTLDWYQEVEFVPTVRGSTFAAKQTSHTQQSGHATRIGNRVLVSGTVAWTTTQDKGEILIDMSGLPFVLAARSETSTLFTIRASSVKWNVSRQLVGRGISGTSTFKLEQLDPTGGPCQGVPISASGVISFSGTFMCD